MSSIITSTVFVSSRGTVTSASFTLLLFQTSGETISSVSTASLLARNLNYCFEVAH